MKRSELFILKEMAGQYILVPFGEMAAKHRGVIQLNETAKFFWDNLENDTDVNTLADLIVEKYGIDRETALVDTVKFIDSLKEDGCIDE